MDKVIRIRSYRSRTDHLVAKLNGRVVITRMTIPPDGPHIGELTYNHSTAEMTIYDGTKWVKVQSNIKVFDPVVLSDTVLYGFRVHIDSTMLANKVTFDTKLHGFRMNSVSLYKVTQWRDSRVSTVVEQELLDNLAAAVKAMKRYMKQQHYTQPMRRM